MLKYKIVLAGTKDVGKSSLIARFCDNVFDETMMSTIGVAFKRKKMQLEDKLALDVNIWDFAGEEKYRDLFPAYANGAAAALILYDTTNRHSLEDITNWVDIIDKSNDEEIIKVLIGTKIDLIDQRVIDIEEARARGKSIKIAVDVIETSAKTGENVENAFIRVAKEIVKHYMQNCKACGEFFGRNLRFCNYCGEKSSLT